MRTNKSHTLIFSGAHGLFWPCATGNSAVHDVGGPGFYQHLVLVLVDLDGDTPESSVVQCFSLYLS